MRTQKRESKKVKKGVFDKLYEEILTPLFENISDTRSENLSYDLSLIHI